MKKTIFSTFLFIIFLLFLSIFYLSFFGYETNKFNQIIKSEIKGSNEKVALDFEKISILLDIKKLTLFVNFINPQLNYLNIPIPLKLLRTDLDIKYLKNKKIVIKNTILTTDYLDFIKIKPLLNEINLNIENLKNIKSAKFRIKDLKLEFDQNYKLNKDFVVNGDISTANIKISDEYEIKNLNSNFFFKKGTLNLNNISWSFNDTKNSKKEFFDGKLNIKHKNKNYDISLSFKTINPSSLPELQVLNYSFNKDNISEIETKILINKNNKIHFVNLLLKDQDNKFQITDLYLDKNYNLIKFNEIHIKTSLNKKINNDFKIINKNKIIIKGKVFDAKKLIKQLSKDNKNNKFLKKFSKDVDIDFDSIIKGTKFPIKNFRLVGKINKGSFEKILAKSDYTSDKHLDISLNKQKNSDMKILEIYSDIATPLLSDYKFFQGLEGGNLIYVSKFNKLNSTGTLKVNDFKLNKAPTLAKILTLADLKGLTDTLKGEGISFDTLSATFESNSLKTDIKEIFMVGPSISLLIDGYVEKKSGLISLRGTLVPAKTLNNIISKIPVVGDILIGKKVGEGVFGISFKIKGLPNNLKTTVNPIKTLTPRFITRALEAAKKKAN
tara:strand:- start:5610 stop:7439 length:1830 start_codon:yes stop_codon:yes gene_type:complete